MACYFEGLRVTKMKKILIIEDDENIANAEKLILEGDYEVHVANEGDTGFEIAKKINPDLIILDLMLPNRGGYDVCYNIRQDKNLKNTKVLMVTALNQQVDKSKGVMVGTDAYLTKPFEAEDLLSNVSKLLNGQ